MSAPHLETHADAATAARAAAGFIAECARRAVADRGKFLVAFSGGSTPMEMLGALVAEDISWRKLHIFQVDERAAPHGHRERNLTQLEESLIGTTPLTLDALHAMPVEQADLDAAARHYADTIAAAAGSSAVLDLVHLGLGEDGHTASLIPGYAVVEISDRDVAVTEAYHGHRRMTLTLPMLDRARQRLWLVTGSSKAAMLARLIAGDKRIPAGRVAAKDSVIFADRTAASESVCTTP